MLRCPSCGKKELKMVEYNHNNKGYRVRIPNAQFECQSCGHKERVR
jgi:C4-type Zn-finger protein